MYVSRCADSKSQGLRPERCAAQGRAHGRLSPAPRQLVAVSAVIATGPHAHVNAWLHGAGVRLGAAQTLARSVTQASPAARDRGQQIRQHP